MPVTVSIPTIMRPLTGGEKRVAAQGATLAAVIDNLETNHPGLKDRLLSDGKLNRYVNIYIDDEDVRFAGGLAADVPEGGTVTILPAVAGGSSDTAEVR
jgi:molybdopterin converting factor small subunit